MVHCYYICHLAQLSTCTLCKRCAYRMHGVFTLHKTMNKLHTYCDQISVCGKFNQKQKICKFDASVPYVTIFRFHCFSPYIVLYGLNRKTSNALLQIDIFAMMPFPFVIILFTAEAHNQWHFLFVPLLDFTIPIIASTCC